jgi:threonine/homoserine/homoserine lactone efflux protein
VGELIFKAIVTGLILSMMIGPAFFLLLETSIKKGIRTALFFDFGILTSDLIYISIAYLFYAEVAKIMEGHNELLKIIGGSTFLIFGIISILKKPSVANHEDIDNVSQTNKDNWLQFLKGLMLNMANPMVIFYWFSVMALSAKNGANNVFETILFIGILLSVFFSIDLLKIIGAKKLRPFITDPVLRSLNRITGSILSLFGIVLLLQGILEKF